MDYEKTEKGIRVPNVIKRHRIAFMVLGVILYVVIGALAPFMHYSPVSQSFQESFSAADILEPEESPDRAMLLETNISAWEERIRLMNMASERIILSTFDMRDGESTRDLLSVLLHKADEGVQVQILVDGFSDFLRMEGRPVFYALSSHPNVEIRIYNPIRPWFPWTLQGRMHDKYVIADDQAYILGGRNTFDYFIGDYETENKSFDRELLIYNSKGPGESSLNGLMAYFQEVRPDLFEPFDYAQVTEPTQGVELLSGETGIYGKEPRVFYMLSQLMAHAQEQVIIHTPYAVCNDYMYDTLTNLCAQVPDVTMMVNSVENGDNLVASSDYLKNKGHLIETGLEIYEYDGGISYHGKSVVIDNDISIVGSYNLDLRSTYMDTELMLVVKSEALTQELTGYMEDMHQDCRKVIDARTYETPPHLDTARIPPAKRFFLGFLGILLAPFRCVI